MNRIIKAVLLTAAAAALLLCSCGETAAPYDSQSSVSGDTPASAPVPVVSVETESDELGGSYTEIILSDSGISVTGSGATVSGSTVTITEKGSYLISGSLSDGRIIVNAEKADGSTVRLFLNGITVNCSYGAPLYIQSAKKTVITLCDGTLNSLSDSDAGADDEQKGCLYSRDDTVINGSGSLSVDGKHNGIHCLNDLRIQGGTVTVSSKNHGIKGNDSVIISEGAISVECGGDGIKTDNTEEADKGFILVTGGSITVDAGDDGFHADRSLTVNGGTITVTNSYEGLEATEIYVNGGTIDITASDDGVNAADCISDAPSGWGGGMKAQNGVTLEMNGGYLHINASGDGFDSNNTAVMTGGTLIIEGPTDSGNGAIDYEASFTITGGTLIAVGASGMTAMPSAGTQCAFMTNVPAAKAGSTVSVCDSDGNELFSTVCSKAFGNVVFSSPELETGRTYVIKINGVDSATVSQSSVRVGSQPGGMGGGMGGGKRR